MELLARCLAAPRPDKLISGSTSRELVNDAAIALSRSVRSRGDAPLARPRDCGRCRYEPPPRWTPSRQPAISRAAVAMLPLTALAARVVLVRFVGLTSPTRPTTTKASDGDDNDDDD